MNYLFDTNAIIYFLKGEGSFPVFWENDKKTVSVISKIELLSGWKDENEEKQINIFLGNVEQIGLTENIIDETIKIRRRLSLKTPDAIIVATAKLENAKLITADKELIKKIDVIEIIDPLS